MRIRIYLLYFLILVVAGVIAVGIYYAFRDRESTETSETQSMEPSEKEAEAADIQEESGDIMDEEENGKEEGPLVLEGHYTSSSTDFPGYTFRCPEGWKVYEEDGGRRLLAVDGPGDGKYRGIMVLVKDAGDEDESTEAIMEEYQEIHSPDSLASEPVDMQHMKTADDEVEVTGYYYDSGLASGLGVEQDDQSGGDTGNPGEMDMITSVEEDGHIYILKYSSSGIGREASQYEFRRFLSGFTIGSEHKGELVAEASRSVNILILGLDSGMGRDWGRRSARSDINMILHINLETYGATIVTIPRDLWVPIPGHGEGKINGAHAIGGPELSVQTFEDFSGLDIDNYIVTDFDGFIPLIDFLGGVTIEVNEDLADGFSDCYLSRGVHHLDGEQALALCRNRHRSGDGSTQGGAWAREREAAKVIKALYEQKTTLEKILALPAFADFLLRYTWTDMGFAEVLRILPALGYLGDPEIELRGVPSHSKTIGKASAVVHFEDETEQLFEEIKNQ